MLGADERRRSLAGDVARLDGDLARLGRALDALYALERGGAERQAHRRTREVAVSLGEARLEAVKQALIARGRSLSARRPPRAAPPSRSA